MELPKEYRKPLTEQPGIWWRVLGTPERTSPRQALDDLIGILKQERYRRDDMMKFGIEREEQVSLVVEEGYTETVEVRAHGRKYGDITIKYVENALESPVYKDWVASYHFKVVFDMDQLGPKLGPEGVEIETWEGPMQPISEYERDHFLRTTRT